MSDYITMNTQAEVDVNYDMICDWFDSNRIGKIHKIEIIKKYHNLYTDTISEDDTINHHFNLHSMEDQLKFDVIVEIYSKFTLNELDDILKTKSF